MPEPRAVRRWAALPLLLAALFAGPAAQAAELKGTVVEVAGTTVKIRLEGQKLPRVGDKVQVGSEVPGVGFVAAEGTWRVSQADDQAIVATPDGAGAGKPTPGMAARVDSAAPQERPRPVPGPGTPATPRVDPTPRPEATGRAWLGVAICELEPGYAAQLGAQEVRGVLVTDIYAGSPADQFGLMPEDIITGVGAQPVSTREELVTTVRAMRAGQRVRLYVFRDGAEKVFDMELAGVPSGAVPPWVDYGLAAFDVVVNKLGSREAKRAGLPAGTIVLTGVGAVASGAGARRGDVIVSCNGRPATVWRGFGRFLYRLQPGDPVALTLKRDTQQFTVRIQAREQLEANGGGLSKPVELAAIGLVVRELNRATAQHLGIQQTHGIYIERVSRPDRLPAGGAEVLQGGTIKWANGKPVCYLRQLRQCLDGVPAVRLLCRHDTRPTVWAVLAVR